MAVTPNLNLYKPSGDDYVSNTRDLNANYDIIDSAIKTNLDGIVNTRKDIGIVEDADTATHNITRDSLVIWKGELYVAKSTISIGNTLSSSNLEAISNGLQSRIPTVASRTLAGNDDFNNLPNFGLYPFSVGSTNQPPITWGMLLNLPYASGNAIYQLAWNRHDIYYRDYTGSPLNWSAWKKAGKDENDKITNMLTTESGTVNGTYGSTYYYRQGNICYITSTGRFASSAFTSYAVGQLPTKCRPKAGSAYGMMVADNDSNSTGLLYVDSSGNVSIQCRGSWWYEQNVRGDATFPCVGDI